MTRYTMPVRSQGRASTHRESAKNACDGIHTRVPCCTRTPDVETLVRKWLSQRLDGFRCDLQAMYTPPPMSTGVRDEIVSANAYGLSSTETAEAVIEATGSNPHMTVCGRPPGATERRKRRGRRCDVA